MKRKTRVAEIYICFVRWRISATCEKKKSYVGLTKSYLSDNIFYVGLIFSYVGDNKPYAGNIITYVGLST